MVIEIDDVEYLVDDKAVEAIERGDEEIDLLRIYDHERISVHVSHIEKKLLVEGASDYLDKK